VVVAASGAAAASAMGIRIFRRMVAPLGVGITIDEEPGGRR
jgi:hypothetical protein